MRSSKQFPSCQTYENHTDFDITHQLVFKNNFFWPWTIRNFPNTRWKKLSTVRNGYNRSKKPSCFCYKARRMPGKVCMLCCTFFTSLVSPGSHAQYLSWSDKSHAHDRVSTGALAGAKRAPNICCSEQGCLERAMSKLQLLIILTKLHFADTI